MFLEGIYSGGFDPDLLRAAKPVVDTVKVAGIAGAYRDLMTAYPAERLEEGGGLPPELLGGMRKAGLFGLTIGREYGGQGLNLWEYLRVIEEMVKLDISVAITFLAHLSIGVKGIQLFGNEEQRQKYLPRAASGEMIFSYALTEPRIGSDARHIETSAAPAPDGNGYILNGRKAYITNANYAGGLTVFAQLDPKRPGYIGAFIVETGWEGVQVGMEMPKMGLKASSTAAIQFRNVRIPVENRIGEPGDGFKIAMSVLNYGRLGLGAASVALMDVSARDMLKRASSRIQFQVPIKRFQLVQEKIVRTKVNGAVSAAMNDFAAGLLQKDPFLNTAIETSHCKLFGTTRAWDAVYDGLQVAGGAGYLKTHPYEKRMRDFRVATVFEGTTEIHSIYPALFGLRRLGALLTKRRSAFLTLLGWLLHAFVRKPQWPLRFADKTMQAALDEARANARVLRKLLCAGMLFHGRRIAKGDIGDLEYFLRRITALSLSVFGLLALLARMEESGDGRRLAEDLDILRYFVEEAKEVRRQNGRIFDSGKDRAASAVFRRLDGAQERPEALL